MQEKKSSNIMSHNIAAGQMTHHETTNLELQCKGTLSYFSPYFTKGNNFSDFLSAKKKNFQKQNLLLKYTRTTFFPSRVEPR